MKKPTFKLQLLAAVIAGVFSNSVMSSDRGWICSYPAYKVKKDEPDRSVIRKFVKQGDYFVDDKYSYDKYKILEDSEEGVIAVRSEAKPKTTYTGIWAYIFLIDKRSGDFRIAHLNIEKNSNPLSIGKCMKM